MRITRLLPQPHSKTQLSSSFVAVELIYKINTNHFLRSNANSSWPFQRHVFLIDSAPREEKLSRELSLCPWPWKNISECCGWQSGNRVPALKTDIMVIELLGIKGGALSWWRWENRFKFVSTRAEGNVQKQRAPPRRANPQVGVEDRLGDSCALPSECGEVAPLSGNSGQTKAGHKGWMSVTYVIH